MYFNPSKVVILTNAYTISVTVPCMGSLSIKKPPFSPTGCFQSSFMFVIDTFETVTFSRENGSKRRQKLKFYSKISSRSNNL